MKRIGALLLALAMCLLAVTSAAAEANPVAQNGAIAAYVDGNGKIFLPGRAEAINKKSASGIVSVDAYRALFFSPDNFLGSDDLYMIDLQSFEETLIASDVHAACRTDEDTVYYVVNANRQKLMRVDLNTLSAQLACSATEPIDRLYLSAEGLVFQMVDQAGAMLYVEETGRFEIYTADIPRQSLLTDSYELYLTSTGELYLKNDFNYTSDLIDTDVLAFTHMNGTVYYLCHTGSAVRLKAYDPATMAWQVVLTPGVRLENQLTASAYKLFLLGKDGSVYLVDAAKGTMSLFKSYGDLSGYRLPAGYEATGLRIEAMSGQLNVYAVLEEKSAKPDFSFIEFESETEAAEAILTLIDTCSLYGEQNAWEVLKPAKQYATLSRGSRGDAVRAIQEPLYNLGYYDYYIDGIYGPRTEYAVRLLQWDLDRPATGAADGELQRIILSGKLSAYDPYVSQSRGGRGLRVTIMQERLRELGYLADAADGIYGPRTQKAIQLFQSENGLEVSDRANRATLKLLYSDRAERCSSYIDLYPGDTGYRVRELNNRLKELYYLESSVGSSYTSETTSAVRVFQRTAGLPETGKATKAVLRALFASDAPEAPGYITLRRGDENRRVERLQRRLKELGYFDGRVNGYFGKTTKEAVALFQKKVGLKPTGVATVRTQQLLFASDAPVYVPPTIIGTPVITLDAFDYIENDIYCVSDNSSASGYITFAWDTEGSVESYNVRIYDQNGMVYLDNSTLMTLTGVSISTLNYDTVYTLEITAYPEDGDISHITAATASFVRKEIKTEPDIGNVGTPIVSIDTVARMENDVSYVQPGTITFHWFAEGDVQSYSIEIRDEGDNAVANVNTTDLQASINSSSLNQGEIYTVFVSAIPVNGTINDARIKFMRFALPVIELPEPDPTPEPTPMPTPEPTVEPTPEPDPTEEPTIAPQVDPSPETPAEPEPPLAPGPEMPAESMQPAEPEQPTEPEQTVEPEQPGESEQTIEPEQSEEPAPEPPMEPAPEPPMEPAPEPIDEPPAVSAPVLSLNASSVDENGVALVTDDIVTMSWASDGDIGSYYVEVTDADNQVIAATTTDQNSLSARASGLVPGEVYTLDVTAIPASGTLEDGVSSSTLFGVPTEAEPEPFQPESEPEYQQPEPEYQQPEPEYQQPEPEYQQPEPEYQQPEPEYQQPEPEYQQPEPEYQQPEPEYQQPEPQPAAGFVTEPAIYFSPVVGIDESGATLIDGGSEAMQMSWYADGEVAGYNARLFDPNGQLLASKETNENALSAYTSMFAGGQVYTLSVTAIPVNGSIEDGQTASATFCIQAPQPAEPEYQEPEPEYQQPEPEYQEPEPEYQQPEPEYQQPEPEYQQPEPEYRQPEPEYRQPEPEYRQPEPEYQEPEPEYQEPEPEYQQPEPEYQQPEPEYQEPEPEYQGDSGTSSIGVYSDSSLIQRVQARLEQWRWLEPGSYSPGALDGATVQAVERFQNYCANNLGASLTPVNLDPSSPSIDAATLSLLMNDYGDVYSNPDA